MDPLRLAYAHECGLVLVDTIQKCVVMNASLSDLYANSPSSSRAIAAESSVSIQPFATSAILQQHYSSQQAAAASLDALSASNPSLGAGGLEDNGAHEANQPPSNGNSASQYIGATGTDSGAHKSAASVFETTSSNMQHQQQPTSQVSRSSRKCNRPNLSARSH